jgi:DNA polymerase III subunit epsilon
VNAPWHLGPMLAFDIESTGTDVESDRIVTACTALIDGTGAKPPEVRKWLISVAIDIPAEASAIHGVTTEIAREHGAEPGVAIEEIANTVTAALWAGIPVVAYNAPFDLTILDRETRREGLEPLADLLPASLAVIDPLVLDKYVDPFRRGSRKLTDVCAHYGVRLDQAHDAAADAIGAARVAWQIARKYPALASKPLAELHQLQVRAKAEQAKSFQDHLRRKGSDEVIDPSWPIRQLAEVPA